MKERPSLEAYGEVLTTTDLGLLMGRSRSCVQQMAERGEIPAHKFGRNWRFYKRELLKYFSGEWQPQAPQCTSSPTATTASVPPNGRIQPETANTL